MKGLKMRLANKTIKGIDGLQIEDLQVQGKGAYKDVIKSQASRLRSEKDKAREENLREFTKA